MKTCMFVYNNCRNDQRVLKSAGALAKIGHEVRIVAVLDKTTIPRERRGDVQIVRIARDPIHLRTLRGLRSVRRALHGRQAESADRRGTNGPVAAVSGVAQAAAGSRVQQSEGVPARAARAVAALPRRTLLRAHKPLMFLDYYQRSYTEARRWGADAYHAHDLNTLPVAAALARRTRGRLVYDAHELYSEISTLSPFERRVWAAIERRLITRADRVVTVCESIADELVLRYGIDRPTVVLNAPPRLAGTVARRPEALRTKAGIDDPTRPIVLYQGGFIPNRGLLSLVAAAKHLETGAVVLMGGGRLEPELREAIHAERLDDTVRIVETVPYGEVQLYAAAADLGVIPYEAVGLNNYYTTPNKLFEYIGAGLPIVASPFPELRRFVEGFDLGVVCDPTPWALAASLNALLSQPSRREQMRRNAVALRDRFTWEREAPKLVALYE